MFRCESVTVPVWFYWGSLFLDQGLSVGVHSISVSRFVWESFWKATYRAESECWPVYLESDWDKVPETETDFP